MRRFYQGIITAIAVLEAGIGLVTMSALVAAGTVVPSWGKPFALFLFVGISALLSLLLGIGIYRRSGLARILLVFFSGYIALSKVLLMAGIITFGHEIVTCVPFPWKTTVSFVYHLLILIVLTRPAVKGQFT